MAYFTARHETVMLFSLYAALFICFLGLIHLAKDFTGTGWLIGAGILFRLVLLPSFPHLSDDIYRFVWDGRLMLNGYDPFTHLPAYYMSQEAPGIPGITSRLYNLLNSPGYFTIYPPVAQGVFWIAVKLYPDSVYGSTIILRVLILLAEGGSMWLMIKLLERYKRDKKNILFYALNPLVILELTGNLHFEAFMIFFLLLSLFLFERQLLWPSALFMAMAISVKLIPLMFLPLFIRYLPFKKVVYYYFMVLLFVAMIFWPLLQSDLVHGMFSSLSLYFEKFEFNASIYYLVREIGYHRVGYNIIESSGKWLAALTITGIVIFSLVHNVRRLSKPGAMLWVILIYLLLATTVHPWYISTLVALSIFTPFRFPILWCFFIFLSYSGYSQEGFHENLWITTLEYVALLTYIIYEFYNRNNLKTGYPTLPAEEG